MSWTCPHCDSINDENSLRCPCGHEVTEEKQRRLITSSDAQSQQDFVTHRSTRPASKLRRGFWISLGAIILSIAFLFVAYNYPQLIFGPAPSGLINDVPTNKAGLAGMYQNLKILNYKSNVKVMQEIAEGAVFLTFVAGLILFILVMREEKKV